MTKKELKSKIIALGELDEDVKAKIVCSLIGHSNITTTCFGYVHCHRCGDQIGDTLGGYYPQAKNQVIVDHDCDACNENWKKMTWQDKYLIKYTPKAFVKKVKSSITDKDN